MFQKCRYGQAPNANDAVQQLQQLQVDHAALQELNAALQEVNVQLMGAWGTAQAILAARSARISEQGAVIAQLSATVSTQAAVIAEHDASIRMLQQELAAVRAEMAHLCAPKSSVQLLVADDTKFGIIVVDGNGALFGTLQGNTRCILVQFTVDLPKNHGRGGQLTLLFAPHLVKKRHDYLRKVAETAVTCFITNEQVSVAGLVLAGSADFYTELAQSGFLAQRLEAKIVNTVNISYGDEQGFNQAIELSADCLARAKFVLEKKLIGKFFDEVSQKTGKVCFGVDETVQRLESGTVETLICWENLDIMRYVLRNTSTGEKQIAYLPPNQTNDKSNLTDKDTGAELEEEEKMALLKWLANEYKNFGATLEMVTDKSPEGSQFVREFGGIGGMVRCKVEPPHFDTSLLEDQGSEHDFDLDAYIDSI
ncbi:eukaryotic peptide chain release factor subunit 1-like [Paramacrobiotus metropolitanus]|uniref:eukaryotic peptide chain release factor subunit 1-like n=1 Tax=Paramacrobiotus metropolitanus TaxID=2943436 RepID=UPI002445C46F|nr:eukaryotic peptide chain release factor subunit 1-like [Paramacrobiotus metropolitanus]XP_055344515.1 eukaryotic peptide chain release factor subunit 1-like [Paramacrobiotus metropolitanus]XP_055344516.1 eukaryotic peptide chain release factor subunit 1-like [Paramacrobiotus metropolitanus]XP_055344517.1 eukaryotic peptide chain release factor subunit 1-like [Paramacrobiotus metropolitanus]XP_055344518.1 eukaryotic peptide chain release factor subunit 1-like [Paramacrobiotus metropolitanus]